MTKPFAYVLYIEHDKGTHFVSVHQTLDEAEAELREFAESERFDGKVSDNELVEMLAEYREYPRIYAVAKQRGRQVSTDIWPFARTAKTALLDKIVNDVWNAPNPEVVTLTDGRKVARQYYDSKLHGPAAD
jgi:hypothetical protein